MTDIMELPQANPSSYSTMAFYEINLAVLGIVNVFLLYRQRRQQKKPIKPSSVVDPLEERNEKNGQDAVVRFKREFYPAYVLVFAAAWMQVRWSSEQFWLQKLHD